MIVKYYYNANKQWNTIAILFRGFNINELPYNKNVKIIKYENDILALDKPINILSHPNNNNDINKSIIKSQYNMSTESYILNNNQEIWLCNRLDSATSGVIILSTCKKVADIIKSQFKNRIIKKIYIAKVFGQWNMSNEQVWIDNMNNNIKFVQQAHSIVYKHNCQSSSTIPITSLIELHPMTGFTHQLRYQCKEHNYPIVGDKLYGNYDYNKIFMNNYKNNRLFLHSKNIKINYTLENQLYQFIADSPIPAEFFS